MTTGSPTSTSVTPGPTSTTRPAPSCPPTIGNGDGQVTGHQVLVGVAQAAGGEPEQHLARTGRIELDLLDLPLAAQPPEHRRRRPHGRRSCPALPPPTPAPRARRGPRVPRRPPRVGEFRARVGGFRARVGGFRARVGEFRARVGEFRARVGGFRARVGEFRVRVGAKPGCSGGRQREVQPGDEATACPRQQAQRRPRSPAATPTRPLADRRGPAGHAWPDRGVVISFHPPHCARRFR